MNLASLISFVSLRKTALGFIELPYCFFFFLVSIICISSSSFVCSSFLNSFHSPLIPSKCVLSLRLARAPSAQRGAPLEQEGRVQARRGPGLRLQRSLCAQRPDCFWCSAWVSALPPAQTPLWVSAATVALRHSSPCSRVYLYREARLGVGLGSGWGVCLGNRGEGPSVGCSSNLVSPLFLRKQGWAHSSGESKLLTVLLLILPVLWPTKGICFRCGTSRLRCPRQVLNCSLPGGWVSICASPSFSRCLSTAQVPTWSLFFPSPLIPCGVSLRDLVKQVFRPIYSEFSVGL